MMLSELAEALGATAHGNTGLEVNGVASVANPRSACVVYLEKSEQLEPVATAGAIPMVAEDFPEISGPHLRTSKGKYAFAELLAIFDPRPVPQPGMHPTAFVHETARVAESASIGAFAVVEEGAVVEENVRIYPHVVVGAEAIIGKDSILYPHVTIYAQCVIGQRCIVHSGTVIGADGFGLIEAEEGHTKVPQIGRALIGDDVELGANCCIDRGTIDDTVIERGVKFDNLSHIGHNTTVGEHSRIVAQVGISGSCKIGRHVIFAGQAGSSDHMTIGDYAIIGGRGGVIKDIPPGKKLYSGMPATPHEQVVAQHMALKSLPAIVPQVMKLFERVDKLEKNQKPAAEK